MLWSWMIYKGSIGVYLPREKGEYVSFLIPQEFIYFDLGGWLAV